MFRSAIVATILALGPTAANAQVPAAWDSLYARFSEAYRKLDADMVSNLYTQDAIYLQPNSAILKGRPEILKVFDAFFSSVRQRGDSLRITFDFVDRAVSGNLGYDIGHYSLTSFTAGQPRTGRGKFTVIWKRGADGKWLIHSDGYSGVP